MENKMGRPRKYTQEEARKLQVKRNMKYRRDNYERFSIELPLGTKQRIKEAVELEKTKVRPYILSAIEERLKKTDENFKNPLDK